jgi:Putative Flp pilus-assembly TadE/G-like
MKRPAIQRRRVLARSGESGITILLVAAALVAIMAMAALSIDVVTLYLANAEAQRAADGAALAGARILSLSGMTGDPTNASGLWSNACSVAQQVATAVATQDTMGGATLTAGQVTVTFADRNGKDCAATGAVAFGVNPLVTVKVQRTDLPTFFARIWGRRGNTVSATATAEVFNSSDAKDVSATNQQSAVQPRCVKPWLVPNQDPGNSASNFVSSRDGSIHNPGINQSGGGVIGEQFTLQPDCKASVTTSCVLSPDSQPKAGTTPPTLDYVAAVTQGPFTADPACATGDAFQSAVGGCDDGAVYECGVNNAATADLTVNPASDTSAAVQCLTQSSPTYSGADRIDPTVFPFQIHAGAGSPLVTNGVVASDAIVTSSDSIVTVPIYTGTLTSGQVPVTVVGFLQLFIDNVDAAGNMSVHVLNVAGCGNPNGPPAVGSSPVPIRLVATP